MKAIPLLYALSAYLRAFEFWNFSNFEHENEPLAHIVSGTLFLLLVAPLIDTCNLLVAVRDWAEWGEWRLP